MDALRTISKTSPGAMRAENRQLVLQTISQNRGSISRADIVRRTRLNTATVSSMVAGLLADGLVAEVGVGPSIGGKPPVLLDLDADFHAVVTVSISRGEWRISRGEWRIAAYDLRGTTLAKKTVGSPDGVMVSDLAREVRTIAEGLGRRVIAVGIAVPGLVDKAGIVRHSVTLGWRNYDLLAELRQHLDYPLHLLNDSDAAALAEVSLHQDSRPSLMALYVGTGVGAGLVLSGSLYQGDNWTAGEVGHINLRTHTTACECGRTGCLEAVANLSTLVPGLDGPDSEPRVDARAARTAAKNIAALLLVVYDLLDVRHTVICGPVCRYGPFLTDLVREELSGDRSLTHGDISVSQSDLGEDSAELGAAVAALNKELGLVWTPR